jgi:hypothetical protein
VEVNEDWHELAPRCLLQASSSFPCTFSLLTGPVTLALWFGLLCHCALGYGLAYVVPTVLSLFPKLCFGYGHSNQNPYQHLLGELICLCYFTFP